MHCQTIVIQINFAVYLNLGSLVILNPTSADFDWAGKLLAWLVPPPLWPASQPQRRWNGPTARRAHWGLCRQRSSPLAEIDA